MNRVFLLFFCYALSSRAMEKYAELVEPLKKINQPLHKRIIQIMEDEKKGRLDTNDENRPPNSDKLHFEKRTDHNLSDVYLAVGLQSIRSIK